MNCDVIRPLLDRFHDGELAPPMATAVRAHAGNCTACARALASRNEMGQLLRRHRTSAPESLGQRIRAGSRSVTPPRTAEIAGLWTVVACRLAAAALGAVVVGAGWWATSGNAPTLPPTGTNLIGDLRGGTGQALGPTDRDLDRLRNRPENRVLVWARQENRNR